MNIWTAMAELQQARRRAEDEARRAREVSAEELRTTAGLMNQGMPMGTARTAPASAFTPAPDLLDYSAMSPLVGDVTGPMADLRMYARNPQEMTAANLGLSALGVLPFLPSVAGVTRSAGALQRRAGGSVAEELDEEALVELEGLGRSRSVEQQALKDAHERIYGGQPIPEAQGGQGRLLGAPAGVTSEAQVDQLADEYAEKIFMADAPDPANPQMAGAGDIRPGYFYDKGAQTLAAYAEDPQRAGRMMGPTSTQVGPAQNINYMIKAFDDAKYANEVNVGLYPNNLRPVVEEILAGNDPWMGYKLERYAAQLGGKTEDMDLLIAGMPPNDQWEGRAVGFTTIKEPTPGDKLKKPRGQIGGYDQYPLTVKGRPPSGPNQVAFVDEVRRRALDRVNARRAEKGKRPLTLPEAQEVHWQVIRRLGEGMPLGVDDASSVRESMAAREVLHPYEMVPGKLSGIEMRQDPQGRQSAFMDVLTDERYKDEISRATGAQFIGDTYEGSGVYQDERNPNAVARTFAAFYKYASEKNARGVVPSSMDRLTLTEAVRNLFLAQDGGGAYLFMPRGKDGKLKDVDAVRVRAGGQLSRREMEPMQNRLEQMFGADNVGIIPTPDGYDIRIFDEEQKGAGFQRRLEREARELLGPDYDFGEASGPYQDRNWDEATKAFGGQTKMFLDTVRELTPQGQKVANAMPLRRLATKFAQVHDELEREGLSVGAQPYIDALRTYAKKGIKGLEEMVKAGTAPAVVLTLALEAERGDQEGPEA